MPDNPMTLAQWIQWALEGGCGALAYWLMERIPQLHGLKSDRKFWAASAIAIGLAWLLFALSVAMGYNPQPETANEALEQLFLHGFVAFFAAKALHATFQLSKRTQ